VLYGIQIEAVRVPFRANVQWLGGPGNLGQRSELTARSSRMYKVPPETTVDYFQFFDSYANASSLL